MVLFPGAAVVKFDIEAALHCDYQLLKCPMSVTRPRRAAGHVVEIVNTLYLERQMVANFDESEITPRVDDLWQLKYFAVLETHSKFSGQADLIKIVNDSSRPKALFILD